MSITQVNNFPFAGRVRVELKAPPGFGSDPSHFISSSNVLLRNRTGQRLPNFHKVIADGGNATTPLTARWESVEAKKGNYYLKCYTSTNGPWEFFYEGDVCFAPPLVKMPRAATIDPTFADNAARAKFYKRLREVRTQISGTTFLGELRESLHMIRRPADALRASASEYIGLLRKRKKASPKHWLKGIGGTWLEYSFGWIPLISDIQDGVKAYSRIGEKPRERVLSAGFTSYKDSTSSLPPSDFASFIQAYQVLCIQPVKHLFLEEAFVRYKGKVRAQAETTQWDNWNLFGFNTKEFLPTAWELLPWSFLVDYFTNIGDILNSVITDTADVVFVNRSTGIKTIYSGQIIPNAAKSFSLFGTVDPSRSFMTGPALDFRSIRRDVTRTPNSGISLPTLQFSFGLGDGQLANIAALLSQSRSLHPQNPRPLSALLRRR